MAKYIFVLGGVVSGLGKGITAASLGMLLKSRGLRVFVQKFDPYMNVDPGAMSPLQHGEVFVTADGTSSDLDLGHYERFIDTELNKNSSVTSGKIYLSVLNKERRGDYLGGTVQIIPHVTNEIRDVIYRAGSQKDVDIVITEIGGTIGDIESLPFIETIRQIRSELGKENVLFLLISFVPLIKATEELKSKPTQHSVKTMRSFGIQPDIIVCRSEQALTEDIKAKIALFCDVPRKAVVEAVDAANIYEVPLTLMQQGMDDIVCEQFQLRTNKRDISAWTKMLDEVKNAKEEIEIALVGKYIALHDAYLSVVEALHHAGYRNGAKVNIRWVDAEEVTTFTVEKLLSGVDGVIIPGGFGPRGIEGLILSAKFARENKIPFFAICLGMQATCVEFARDVLGIKDAASEEWNGDGKSLIVKKLAKMRLGDCPCVIEEGTKVSACYGKTKTLERHRNRYEFDPQYKQAFIEKGMVFAASIDGGKSVEMIELKDHPFFIATQAHPEFNSRPIRPQPLFVGFTKSALTYKKTRR